MRPTETVLGEGRLAALSWGDEAAPAWVALHGWLDNAASFARLAPALVAELGIRLVALDLPGHGHSPHRGERADYPLWGYVPDVLEALDGLNLRAATLVGHSMGAGVASLIAAAMPARVERLALIDGLASTTNEPAETVVQLQAALGARERRRGSAGDYPSVDDAVAARVRGGVTPIDADTARPIVERNLARGEDGRYRWRTDRRLTWPSLLRWTPDQMLETVAAIRAPVLLLQATGGVLAGRPHLGDACRRIDRLERRLVSGGHHLHLERIRVAQVAAEIVRWHQSTVGECVS
ncbi:MAG: alpha/beta fold hydrolase [Salinicola sp.]|uniref:alpha/beta fold hydrolase n=1 Tax=Salinicola sp. TaxID=1978524 RepID=UPI001D4FD9F2|nr:alpha/beta hydrolase [Salinicola sp.]NRB58229.1 alpha/beta fold hydrolase [Salinicola sp.]